jgi:hypothetical protein
MAKEKTEVSPTDCKYYEFDEDIEQDMDGGMSDVVYHYCHNTKKKHPFCKLGFITGYCSYFKKKKDESGT